MAENVIWKIDADKVEREKRKSNVVILKAPEPNKDSTAEQKEKQGQRLRHRSLLESWKT